MHARAPGRAIFTIGHSNRTFDELVEVLRAHGVTVLVDIRTLRRSRANPQFNADALGPELARAGIRYEADYAMSESFREGLGALMRIGALEPTAIMCAEALWWRCHRRIVANHLLARGVPVVHLFTKTHAESASLTPFAVLEHDGRLVTYPKRKSAFALPKRNRSRVERSPARAARRPTRWKTNHR